jgi:hypothetical protein
MHSTVPIACLAVAALAGSAGSLAGQSTTSAPVAANLVQELTKRNVTTVAVKDPDQPGGYVAAMYFPGVQLLTIAARSTGPAYLDQLLHDKRYDEVYASLNGASETSGKLFVQDLHADGLKPQRADGGGYDIAYQDDNKTVILDGDWKKQKLTEASYQQQYRQLEERYDRLLSVLLRRLQADGQAPSK